MAYYIVKVLISAILIVLISEISRKSTLAGSILASIPLVSVLGIMWLYIDTKDVERISALSVSIFWLVIPSLALFVALPVLLKREYNFYFSMGLSILITVLCYYLMIYALGRFGIRL